jgi:hypothetical protein
MIANDGIQFLAMAMSEFFAAIWVYCFTTVIKQNTHVLKQCKRLYWGDDDLPIFRQYWVTKENLDWFTNGTSSHLEKSNFKKGVNIQIFEQLQNNLLHTLSSYVVQKVSPSI